MNRRAFVALAASLLALNRSKTVARQNDERVMFGQDPMAAAEYLSRLENIDYIPPLYTLYSFMHDDAKALVPRATVIGWYQEDFQPLGPQQAVATGVITLPQWTWPVSGVTYTNVAEVSYTQQFSDGSVMNDVVRLVFDNGQWNWFFGRDKAWVEEQNLRFSQKHHLPQGGDAPFGLGALARFDEGLFSRMPMMMFNADLNQEYVIEDDFGTFQPNGVWVPQRRRRYMPPRPNAPFELGGVEYGTIVDPTTAAENLDRITTVVQNQPPTILYGWNTAPANGMSWVHFTMPGVDVVGPSYSVTLVSDTNYLDVMMYSEEALETVCRAIAGARPGA
jgi:hypothetical protein